MGRVENDWRDYVTRLYDGETMSKVQYQELREAFYAGFVSLFSVLEGEIAEMDVKKGEEVLLGIRKELYEFRDEIKMRLDAENK